MKLYNMKGAIFLISWILLLGVNAQTLTATFPSIAGELVRFGTFQGIQSRTLDSVKVGANGSFSFSFKTDKPAIGYLITAENKPYFLILDKSINFFWSHYIIQLNFFYFFSWS